MNLGGSAACGIETQALAADGSAPRLKWENQPAGRSKNLVEHLAISGHSAEILGKLCVNSCPLLRDQSGAPEGQHLGTALLALHGERTPVEVNIHSADIACADGNSLPGAN